jgi:hypothetical protein
MSSLIGSYSHHHFKDYPSQTFENQLELFRTSARGPVVYNVLTSSRTTLDKVIAVAKILFSIIVFPVGLYKLLKLIAGYCILPAATLTLFKLWHPLLDPKQLFAAELTADFSKDWKIQRVTVQVDGCPIDVALVASNETLDSDRWSLFCNGNGTLMEAELARAFLNPASSHSLSKTFRSKAVFFNYPSVGLSKGYPCKQTLIKAYRAVLSYMEEGLGAKEIICHGHSLGGGIQAEALSAHSFKQDIRYALIFDRTFGRLSDTAASLTKRSFIGRLIKGLQWELDTIKNLQSLQAPQLIIQSTNRGNYETISDQINLITHDGMFESKDTLAYNCIENRLNSDHMTLIGTRDNHFGDKFDISSTIIADWINKQALSPTTTS